MMPQPVAQCAFGTLVDAELRSVNLHEIIDSCVLVNVHDEALFLTSSEVSSEDALQKKEDQQPEWEQLLTGKEKLTWLQRKILCGYLVHAKEVLQNENEQGIENCLRVLGSSSSRVHHSPTWRDQLIATFRRATSLCGGKLQQRPYVMPLVKFETVYNDGIDRQVLSKMSEDLVRNGISHVLMKPMDSEKEIQVHVLKDQQLLATEVLGKLCTLSTVTSFQEESDIKQGSSNGVGSCGLLVQTHDAVCYDVNVAHNFESGPVHDFDMTLRPVDNPHRNLFCCVLPTKITIVKEGL
eukprot:c4304_g2_i1.p1 GENE.c4304_g2_i1~~c4304_g2_i1.p1  ORF type:complete len:295 (+),score=30.52 c4304_g2_i1:795-1679(+)